MTRAIETARVLALCGLCACASAPRTQGPSTPPAQSSDARRFVWVEAACSDGPLDLAALGFERSVELQPSGAGWRLTMDTEIATRGCRSTAVLALQPASSEHAALFAVRPEGWVRLPAEPACGAEENAETLAEVSVSHDALELLLRGSPWCRGLDARFRYHAVPAQAPSVEVLLMRYAAHFSRGDAEALAQLFASDASLVEPFSETQDGRYARHEGRRAIAEYFASAFESVRWHALRLLSIEPTAAGDQRIVTWEYMDSDLATPLRGRTLFLLAGEELLEAEIQLLTDPQPSTQLADPFANEATETP